jgi:type VI protein secretion system component VasK
MNQQDWRRLRFPILALGMVLVAIGLLVSYADQYYSKNQIALQTQQNLLNQARQKFQSSGQEKQMITQYLPAYNDLLVTGFIGEEHRIEWIENLRQIHNQHKLFSIEYSIGLQENYKPNFLPNLGNFVLHKSTMKLNLDMLHEGDIITLLDGLQQQATPFIVRDCEIKRPVGAVINVKNMSSNMRAVCDIDWLTLRDPQLSGAL